MKNEKSKKPAEKIKSKKKGEKASEAVKIKSSKIKKGEYEITLFFKNPVSINIKDNLQDLIQNFEFKDKDYILSSFFKDFLYDENLPFNHLKIFFYKLNTMGLILKEKKLEKFIRFLLKEKIIINQSIKFLYYDITE